MTQREANLLSEAEYRFISSHYKRTKAFLNRPQNLVYRDKAVVFRGKVGKLEELIEVANAIRFWSEQVAEVLNDKNNSIEIMKSINEAIIVKYKRIINILEIKFKRLKSCL